MKFNLIQFMTFAFILGWVGTDVLNGAGLFEMVSYSGRLYISGFLALIVGYINNGHGMVWRWMKKV